MTTGNQTTLNTYQEHFDNYIDRTTAVTSGSQKEWLEALLGRVDHDTPILEIGSAFGRDAKFMRDAGFTDLTVTDAFDAAIDELRRRGFDAQKLNILTDEPESEYGLIVASAVFLHFTAEELKGVLGKLQRPLGNYGILGFTVKQGDGEEWTNEKMDAPRYFRYWQADELKEMVMGCGYEVLAIGNVDDSQKWLGVTCRPAEV